MSAIADLETTFTQLVEWLRNALFPTEQFTLELMGEHSHFIRFNRARVRQAGLVTDGQLTLTLMEQDRQSFCQIPFTGEWDLDLPVLKTALEDVRDELVYLPIDPYLVLPSLQESSRDVHVGHLLISEDVADAILPTVTDCDFAGLYAGGVSIRAYADSCGTQHWFATDSFTLDYSLFTDDGQAVKGTVAGSDWQQDKIITKLTQSKQQLQRMAMPPRAIAPGQYRTYLAPAAVADLISMFSWGGISESALQRGHSALGLLQRGDRTLSPLFNLSENFRQGLVPRFNSLGETAPIELPLIVKGQLVNTLVCSRTAKEYGKVANGASASEQLRSPEVKPGSLLPDQILAELGTGLYLSNLHYLNWSDRPTGRITGMTRYACFWVEQGDIVAPIENLRFDESLYQCFGDRLVDLTHTQEVIPDVGSYDHRDLGGTLVPGVLVDGFTYTL
ncbi:MAG: TldD/PmbA family protein [Synechococcales cyanobacterium T60_A2020_003]|nr:TldD/PmbA family protein [Synechococcales cyanobacterium T60_A2020_003]